MAIVGENGSGMTTLVKHFIGLLRPGKGKIIVDGRMHQQRRSRRSRIRSGWLFQNPDHMFFADSVFDEVAFGVDNLGIPDREKVVLMRFPRSAFRSPVTCIPGGSRGGAAAAGNRLRPCHAAGSTGPDEPTTGLDGTESREIIEILKQLQHNGHTIIMITHSREIAEKCAARVVRWSTGRSSLTYAGERGSEMAENSSTYQDPGCFTSFTPGQRYCSSFLSASSRSLPLDSGPDRALLVLFILALAGHLFKPVIQQMVLVVFMSVILYLITIVTVPEGTMSGTYPSFIPVIGGNIPITVEL